MISTVLLRAGRLLAAILLTTSIACAHTPSPAEEGLAVTSDTPPALDPSAVETDATKPGVPAPVATDSGPPKTPLQRCESLVGEQRIKRVAVNEVVDAGLGRWLAGVQIDRVLEGRKFKGWRIGVLHLENPCYAAVDLRPGDVVTSINGQGPKHLERPETAQQVFLSLKKAPAIEVGYLREGKPQVLRFEIAETPKP